MENEPLSKKFKLSSNSMVKLSIEKKFRNIINDIDVDTESISMKLTDKSIIHSINGQRDAMIKEIEKVIKFNLEIYEKNHATLHDYETKDENLFENYCVYFDTDLLSDGIVNNDRLGLLIIFDYYVPDSQITAIK